MFFLLFLILVPPRRVAFKEIPQRELRGRPRTANHIVNRVHVAFKEIPQRELRDPFIERRHRVLRVLVAFTEIPKRELRDEYVQSFACLGSCLGCIPRNPIEGIERCHIPRRNNFRRCSQRAAFTEALWRMLCLYFLLFFC